MDPALVDEGLSLAKIGIGAAALTSILVLAFLIADRILRPSWKKYIIARELYNDVKAIDTLETKVEELTKSVNDILEALRPTNGDQRSLSDRVDTAKHNAADSLAIASAMQREFRDYKRDELIERRGRQRHRDTLESDILTRITRLEGNVNTTINELKAGNPEIRLDPESGDSDG